MSQRNFPASFWNSDYQYPTASVSGASGATSSLSSLAMGHAALISGHHTAADIYGAAAHDPYANLFGYGASGNTTGKNVTTEEPFPKLFNINVNIKPKSLKSKNINLVKCWERRASLY